MPLYVIERTFAERLLLDELDEVGIVEASEELGVRWVLSFLAADQKKTYCIYEAPGPEAIRDQAERLGLPVDQIIEVDQFGPMPAIT